MNNPSLYSRSHEMQRRDSMDGLRKCLPSLLWDEDEAILDVGCGSGETTLNLILPCLPADRVSSVTGVDVSKSMVEHARKNCSHNIISYEQMDVQTVDNPRQVFPAGFTKIFSFYCLHWIPDHSAVLDNFWRLMRPTGEAVLVFLASNPVFSAYETLSQDLRWRNYMEDISLFIPRYQNAADPSRAFSELAEDAGFEVVTCATETKEFVYGNENILRNAVAAVNPFIGRMKSKVEQNEFLADLIQLLKEGNISTDGIGIGGRYQLMTVHLRKCD